MGIADALFAIEVGKCARDFKDAVHATRRQCEAFRGTFEQLAPTVGQRAVTIQ